MTVVDTLVFGVLAVGLILGLMRGFLSQITGLVGLLGGVYLAWRYDTNIRALVVDPLISTEHNGKIAFGLIMLVAFIFTGLVSWIISKVFDKMNMSAYDRLMGGLFGVAKAGLICAGILMAVVVLANDGGDIERAIGSSKSGPTIWQALDKAINVLPKHVRGEVRQFLRNNALPKAPADKDTEPLNLNK